MIYVKESTKGKIPDKRRMLEFETLTLAPIDHNMIKLSLLTEYEKKWLNNYHSNVYKELSPILTKTAKSWLKIACKSI